MTTNENQNADVEAENTNVDMPLLSNSSASRNKNIVTYGGYALISLVILAFAWSKSVNTEQKTEKKPQNSEIKNVLPTINTVAAPVVEPPLPAPVVAPPLPPPAPVVAPPKANEKPVITPAMRKMDGNVIVAGGSAAQAKATATTAPVANIKEPESDSGLANSLKATKIAGVSATKLPNRNFLITKGATLGCVLETALDSSLSGLATCRLTRDVYSDNGAVILLDKGSKVVGEYQGGMKQGQQRLFMLWNRVETPNGVIINIDSPSIDPVGRTGVDGWVDNHFADRFGAAILVTLLQTVSQTGTSYLQSLSSNNNNTTIQGSSPQAATEVVKSMLNQSVNIPPTLNKNQGDELQIMIARDLDFSGIYALRANYGR
jgi:type IV secretion system protein VirB10